MHEASVQPPASLTSRGEMVLGKEKLGKSIWFCRGSPQQQEEKPCRDARVMGFNARRLRLEDRHFQINF